MLAPLAGMLSPLGVAGSRRRGVESTYALGFNGVNGYVLSNNSLGITGASPRTISFWAQVNGVNSSTLATFVGYGAASQDNWFYALIFLGNYYLSGFNNDWNTGVPATTGWHHHVITYDGSIRRWYVDGRELGSGNAATLNTLDRPVSMGRRGDGFNDLYLNGSLDDVRIYSRALTADEVSAIYVNNSSPPSSAQVAHFAFEEGTGTSTTDSVGGLTGTLNGGVTWQPQTCARLIAGRQTQDWAVSFDGTDDVVTIPHSAALDITGACTFALWLKPSAASEDGYVLAKTSTATDGFHVYWEGSADRISFGGVNSSTVFVDTGWIHVCVTVTSGGAISFYRNGSPAGTGSASAPSSNATDVTIGNRAGGASAAALFSGLIKDVRIYNTVLPAASIHKLARGVEPDETPVAQWRLNEGTGTTANDSIGSNHGTLTNGPTWSGDVPQWFRQVIESSQSLNLDGVDDYVDTGNLPSLQITGPLTLSYWFKRSAGTNVDVGKWKNAGNLRSFDLEIFSGDNLVYWLVSANGTAIDAVFTSSALTDTGWHELVGVFFPSTTLGVYLDGAPLSGSLSGAIPASLYNTSQPFEIGRIQGGSDRYTTASLDEIRVHSRALSAAEIADQAAGYLVPAGLVSRWKLDGNAQDAVGSNHGTEQGGVGYSANVPGTL